MSQFTAEQKELLELMWKISEECWSAGWMKDHEFELWRAIFTGPQKYGQGFIGNSEIEKLRKYAASLGGWIYFDEIEQEKWIPDSDWRRKFNIWKAKQEK